MTGTTYSLEDLEARVTAGDAFGRPDAERVLATTDLVSVGVLGESARRRRSGDRVTFGRVAVLPMGTSRTPGAGTVGSDPVLQGSDPTVPGGGFGAASVGQAGEVRVVGAPKSLEQALGWVGRAAASAPGVPLTAFNLVDLMALAGPGDGLVRVAAALRAAGLDAVAELPLDRSGPAHQIVAALRSLEQGGLGAWRATVDRAPLAERLNLVELAAEVQASTGALRAFAPLPRLDPADVPSTGYDDVRTVAIASLLCSDIEFIQVDWPLYGPKLAQVAIAFGANDIDGIAVVEAPGEGPRRAPVEDIARQIRAASGQPAERNGRYEISVVTDPVRLGAVSYLNVRPLVYGLEDRANVSLRFDVPSDCARLLASGDIDLGMVPSIAYLDRPGDRIVPGICIGSDGPVASVALYTRRSITEVRSIALDTSSRTSAALVQVLCRRQFGITPTFMPHAPDLTAMLAQADAALLIGDAALFLDHQAHGVEKLDLGELWTGMTGLPFVWAFWAGRPDAATPATVELLQQTAVGGMAHLDDIGAAYCADDPDWIPVAQRYLRENLMYDLSPRALQGLRTYYREAAELGLAMDAAEPQFFRDLRPA